MLLSGFKVLITGPSEHGIGAETALSIAKASPERLILAGRSRTKIYPVIEEIRQICLQIQIDYLELDLSSLQSVRRAIGQIKALNVLLDVVINNAAIMACPFSKTVDGIESQFGTNHIGPFLFTNLLLKEDLISPGGRIVNVNSSASVRKASMILPHFDDLTYNEGKDYNPWVAYSVSKSASMLCSRILAKRLAKKDIAVFSLNPGSIRSPLQRYLTPELLEEAIRLAKESDPEFQFPKPKSLQQGCATQLRAALDPDLAAYSGSYLDDCQVTELKEHMGAYGAADKVWSLSEGMAGERSGF